MNDRKDRMEKAEIPINEVFSEKQIIRAIIYSNPSEDNVRAYALKRGTQLE